MGAYGIGLATYDLVTLAENGNAVANYLFERGFRGELRFFFRYDYDPEGVDGKPDGFEHTIKRGEEAPADDDITALKNSICEWDAEQRASNNIKWEDVRE